MADDRAPTEEERLLKEWLTGLLPDGMSRKDVADELRVTRKTISTLLSPESANFARGLTMLCYLRLAGALKEVPEAGPALSRLAALEALVSAQGEQMTNGLHVLAKEVRALKHGRDDEDPPATQAQADV